MAGYTFHVVDHAHYGDMGELDTSATESTLNRLK
jgi:hypothetical protein